MDPHALQVARAKSTVAQWLDAVGMSKVERRAVLAAFGRLPAELALRDATAEVSVAILPETQGLRATWTAPGFSVDWCTGGLLVGVSAPDWSAGWRSIMPGDTEHRVLSWLLHYARQYIQRSLRLRVVAAVRHARVSDVFGDSLTMHRRVPRAEVACVLAETMAVEAASARFKVREGHGRARRIALSPTWLTANLLDPHLHRAAFHLVRADELRGADFGPESVIQYDTSLVVLEEWGRAVLPAHPSDRSGVLRALGIGRLQALGKRTSFLRNHFGAHSGGWRWWDFDEMFGDDVPRVARLADRALRAAVQIESSHRRVELDPPSWSDWFWTNFETLWRAVWFSKMTTYP
jgi:hypothetical protein